MRNHINQYINLRSKIQGFLMLQQSVPIFTTGLQKINSLLNICDITSKQFNYVAHLVKRPGLMRSISYMKVLATGRRKQKKPDSENLPSG